MATKFYLTNSAAAVSPPFTSSWEERANADRARMATSKTGGSVQARSVPGPAVGSSDKETLVRQCVSDPIGAQTISGTLKAVIPARFGSTNGAVKGMVVAKVVSGDGQTLRGTLLAEAAAGYGADWPRRAAGAAEVTFQNRRFHSGTGTALTSVVAQEGDRIVVEIGAVGNAGDPDVLELLFGDPKRVSVPATVVDDAGIGTAAWTGLDRVGCLDSTATHDVAAQVVPSGSNPSHYLKATNFGFAVPADATDIGITVEIVRRRTDNYGTISDHQVRIVKGGVIGNTERGKLESPWPGAYASAIYGSATDQWGETWTPTDINATGFGVALSVVAMPGQTPATAYVDTIRITVTATVGGADVAWTRDAADNETDVFEAAPWVEFSATITGVTPPSLLDPPPPAVFVPGPVARADIAWQTFLCDRLGYPLADVSALADEYTLKWERNRPAGAALTLPADDELLGKTHTDGLPYLYRRARTLKAYRVEPSGPKLRFAGTVETVHARGGRARKTVAVTAFDPLHVMRRRFARASDGTIGRVAFANTAGSQIMRLLVERTNARGASGLTTEGGVFESTSIRTAEWSNRMIYDVFLDLADAAGGFESLVLPLDRTDGVLGQLSCYVRRGGARPDVIFAYDTPPNTCSDAEWITDGLEIANTVVAVGSVESTNEFVDDTSIDVVGLLEKLVPHVDVSDRALLDALAARDLELSAEARETVKMTPIPGVAAEPFTNFDIGDTVSRRAGAGLLGGFDEQVRVTSFAVAVVETRERLIEVGLTK